MGGLIRAVFCTAILALAAPVAAPAAVRTSHSGWFWGDPRPQGETLDAVEFAGLTGYASGAFGTLLKTTDGGRSWNGLATGLTEPLSTIRLLGPQTLVVGGTCALRRSDDGGRTFRRLPWTASDERCSGGIRSLDFPSPRVGVLLLGNGNVLRSTDSGRTWSRRTAVPNTRASSAASLVEPSDLRFTSETTGFATTTGGDVFITVDAGNTWKAVVAEPWAIRTITFVTPDVGYAAGDAPAVIKTTDGGQTWAEQPLPADAGGLRQMRCATPDVCLGVTGGGDRLVRTVDGGANWESLAASSVSLRAVGLPTATQAVGVGEDGNTVVSDDAGSTFSPVGGVLTGRFTGLSARGAKVAYAFGFGGALARTVDGGQTWSEIDAATSDAVTDVSFLSERVGFVLDDAGQLLRTDNAGDSYEILDTGTAQVPEAVRALDTKRVLLVGPAGVRRSDDGGRTFKPNVQKAVRNAPLFDVDRAGSTVVAYGPRTILLSGDAGRSFRPMRRPSKRVRINDLDLVSARTAFLLDARGPLYRTDDAGRHWRELPALATEVGSRMQFADARHGWVSIAEFGDQPGGWVMRTDDGGATWSPQLVADVRLAAGGLAAGSASVGFTLTRDNELFATSTGGAAGRASRLTLTSPTNAVRRAGDAVRLNGRLAGARGGEHVLVSLRQQGSSRWLFQDVVVASNGTFTVVTRISRTAQFVAQWAGDDARRGAGTVPLTVRVPARR
jgi:photosystem II stability/assembly factor-like uncharacterized protein